MTILSILFKCIVFKRLYIFNKKKQMFLNDGNDEVVVFSEPEKDAVEETAPPKYGYIRLSRYLSCIQGIALAGVLVIATYVMGVDVKERRGANLDNEQLQSYMYLSAIGINVLVVEMIVWLRRWGAFEKARKTMGFCKKPAKQ